MNKKSKNNEASENLVASAPNDLDDQNIEAGEEEVGSSPSKAKKGLSKEKKRIILISSLVAAFLAVALVLTLTLVFVLRPQRKTEVEAFENGQNVYISSTPNSEGLTYRFKFKFGGDEVEIGSDSHILDITNMLWSGEIPLGEEIKISVCYVNSDGVLSGEYGKELSRTFTLTLSAPALSYDESAGTISWTEVRGASEYEIYDLSDNSLAKTDATTFNLSSLAGGERNIYVIATSQNEFINSSNPSNFVTVKVVHQISKLTSATIDSKNNLVVMSDEMLNGLEVTDTQTNEVYIFPSKQLTQMKTNSGKYKITCSLVLNNLSSHSISVKPLTDEYNLYNFEPILIEHN